MKITVENNRFEAIAAYDDRHVLKGAGFWWDNKVRRWHTNKIDIAMKLVEYFDDSAKARCASFLEAVDKSQATTSSQDFPSPTGLNYLGYQRAGIEFALERGGTLIADEMGLGKTIQALGMVNADDRIKSVLCVVPASLRINWEREARKWLIRDFNFCVVNSPKPPPADANFVIVNYDRLKGKVLESLMACPWDMLIVDECHYLKNSKAARTKKVLGIPKQWGRKKTGEWYTKKERVPGLIDRAFMKKVFLTGTPILNRPNELWTLIQALDPDTWRSKSKFEKRYCQAHLNRWGAWDNSGAANLDELQQKLRSTIMIRRKKADVLKELPPKTRQIIVIPADTVEYKNYIKSERAFIEQYSLDTQSNDLLEELNAQVADFSELSEIRKEIALAKLSYVIEHIDEMLYSGVRKVVVFTHHHEVTDKLTEHYAEKCVKLDGRNSLEQKQEAIDAFQQSDVPIFIGGIKAAGVGITLTAASHCVFAEGSWVPGDLTQAEDRLHRIGAVGNVLVQHIVLDDSLDAHITKTIIAKQEVIDQAVEANNLPDSGSKASDPLAKAGSKASNPVVKKTKPNGKKKIVAEILQMLSGMCDGAREQDGFGFNKFDTDFGKKLALRSFDRELTDKEFAVAFKMVRKYKRQIPEEKYKAVYG